MSTIPDTVLPEEIEFYVLSLKKSEVSEIGSEQWLDQHERLVKLSQQAVIEATGNREEIVKDMMVLNSKLDFLVHEAFCVLVWRTKILSKLLEETPNPKATFLIYTIMYHEATAITFLETALYHQNSCESLSDAAIDLIDYSAHACTQLIGLINIGYNQVQEIEDSKDIDNQEFERQNKDIIFHIGMKCITILSYLVDNLDSLPLGAKDRLVKTHDIPCILSEILQVRPWMRRGKKGFQKYIDEKWKNVIGEHIMKVTKPEVQTWFCLRQLMFNQNVMESYLINDFRQRELGKLSGLLNEQILDQLPVLAEVKHYLCSLQLTGHSGSNKSNLVLEELPVIKENILATGKKYGWKKIISEHRKVFIDLEQKDIIEMAQKLNNAYNLDFFASFDRNESDKTTCGYCQKPAEKKCARCQTVYYCSSECQKEDWMVHKKVCIAASVSQ